MKQHFRHSFGLGLMILAALFSLFPTPIMAAQGDTAYLTPASGITQTGNTFTVSVDGTVGTNATTSDSGTVTFPANLLKVTNIGTDGDSFTKTSTITPDNTAGTITFSQTAKTGQSATSTTIHLFAITFQALNVGSATVNLSAVKYNTRNTTMTGGTYTIQSPPSPSPSPSASPSSSPSSSPSTKPTSQPSVTPIANLAPTPEKTPAPVVESDGGLSIENVKITTNRQENTVTWTANSPTANPEFHYGTSKSQLTSSADIVKQDNGSYKVSLGDLKLGTLYYFVIKASTADNLQGATYSGTLITRGYPVQLTIEQNHLKIPNVTVTIEGRTFTATANAMIATELSDGTHKAEIVLPGSNETHSATFTVIKKAIPATGDPETQAFALNITTIGKAAPPESSTSFMLTLIGVGVAAVVIISFVGFLIARRRRDKNGITSADADLLAATYGDAYIQKQRNTPEPNLDTINMPQLGVDIPESDTTAPGAPPLDVQANQIPTSTPVGAPAPTQVDPSSLPLPPLAETYTAPIPMPQQPSQPQPQPQPQPQAQTQTQPQPQPVAVAAPAVIAEPAPVTSPASTYSEDEQLSPELTQVEASQQIEPAPPPAIEEASAVYDEATGELEILHNHDAHEKPVATSKASPVQKEVPPADPTLLSIHQHEHLSPSAPVPDTTVPVQPVSEVDTAPIPEPQPQSPLPQQPLRVNPQT